MSKPSGNRRRGALNEQKQALRRAARKLRQRQAAEGLHRQPTATVSNGKSEWTTVEQEQAARQEAVEEQLKTFRSVLPGLLKRLARIPDPRNPKTVKHQLTVVLLYGLLTFVFQMASRREANRNMSLPVFLQNLRLLFPELETLPHHDTLNRLLSDIEVEALEQAHVGLIDRLIRNKKFQRYLVSHRYPIAVDGTQKFTRDHLWDEQCLERKVRSKEEEEGGEPRKYYVYVLEANLALANGMTIPLMSEFLSYTEGDQLNDLISIRPPTKLDGPSHQDTQERGDCPGRRGLG